MPCPLSRDLLPASAALPSDIAIALPIPARCRAALCARPPAAQNAARVAPRATPALPRTQLALPCALPCAVRERPHTARAPQPALPAPHACALPEPPARYPALACYFSTCTHCSALRCHPHCSLAALPAAYTAACLARSTSCIALLARTASTAHCCATAAPPPTHFPALPQVQLPCLCCCCCLRYCCPACAAGKRPACPAPPASALSALLHCRLLLTNAARALPLLLALASLPLRSCCCRPCLAVEATAVTAAAASRRNSPS
ncbi:unnamed protein product [Closterium sp. NIES-53]